MGTSIRPNGMASGAAALRYWERRQEITANNLANVSTDGYKSERAFARLVENGLPAVDAATNYLPGALRPTGNPLDISIHGQGFFVVQTPGGERFSRGGTLNVSEDGFLADNAGNRILGEDGPILIRRDMDEGIDTIDISNSGVVRVNDREVGTLRIERTVGNTRLAREGMGLFLPPENRIRVPFDEEVVRQGSLEESNVSAIEEMVDMIAIQRAYSAVQSAISTLDATRGIAVTDLGKPVP